MVRETGIVDVYSIRHPRGCRSYVIVDPDSREACVVDPLLDHLRETLDLLSEHKASLRWIVDTHAHGDHLSGAAALAERAGGDVVCHPRSESEVATFRAEDGMHLPFGAHHLIVRHAAGITADSLVLEAPGAMFTGDTLLIGTVGLRDAPGSDADAWFDSLERLFAEREDELVLHPGHDDMGRDRTTLKAERRGNRWLREDDRESFHALYDADTREPRKDAPTILEANRGGLQKVPPDVDSASGFEAPTETVARESRYAGPRSVDEPPVAAASDGIAGLLVLSGALCALGTVLGWMVHPALHAISLLASLLLLGAGLPVMEARRRRRAKGETFYYTGPSRHTAPEQ
jgi:glyoxylase-like metal-dependent hydrolase (beta-lactamase superfamily II)